MWCVSTKRFLWTNFRVFEFMLFQFICFDQHVVTSIPINKSIKKSPVTLCGDDGDAV